MRSVLTAGLITEKAMPEEIKTLIRDYFDGKISRRDFIRKAVSVAGGLVAAETLLERFARDQAYGGEVDPKDPAIRSDNVEFPGKSAKLIGYSAWPSSPGKYPAVIVIHANQGLNDYTRDVARRLAKQGYGALAIDYLSRHGGTSKTNPKGEGLSNIRELAPWQAVAEDSDAGYSYFKALPNIRSDRLGLIGFCWGGEMTFSTATEVRGLNAVVVFYGRSPNPLERVEKIQAPVLAHYGEKDPGVNQDIPATEEAMKQYHKSYTYKIYSDAQHGFHTDTSPERYHPEAAKEAWSKTLEFFRQHLQS
jgi:carboxymethylenebutenolidase